MNPADADRQIEQMIAFIAQEAREKAEEISVKTEKEFMADKLQLERQLSLQIRAEHEKMKKNWAVSKKIEKSKQLTESRVSTMRRRDDKINELKNEVLIKLAEVAKDDRYSDLLKFLISQGLMTLMEDDVVLQCRECDLGLVKKQLPGAIQQYRDVMKQATQVEPKVNVNIDSTTFLPPPPKQGYVGPTCSGGILLSCRDGQIICRNTLDARLDICFESLKPQIRGTLFGVRARIENHAAVERHAVSLPK